jgi:7,8-dihydropterin-6-yl-methyl-4-(beta-D-ribofuranosyl)aminobenzene 5'-phosphate synthase
MKATIIVDNTVHLPELREEWGFSCLIEVEGTAPILFDTGAGSSVLLHNMKVLGVNAQSIGCVFISHDHWDHTGGIRGFTRHNTNTVLYVPESFSSSRRPRVKEIVEVKDPREICDILRAASEFGDVVALIGGLHGFREFGLVQDLDLICATHCTQYKEEIRDRYPDKFVSGGSGKEITV